MALNITTAVIGTGCNAATASPSLAQWDKGQILQISGVELPETYKVEFSNAETLSAIPAIGTADGVKIPDDLLHSSSPIKAYIVLTSGQSTRNTEYWITIYVKPREIPEGIEPDPEQQDVIDDLIDQLNTGVDEAEAAAQAAGESAEQAEAASQAVQDLDVQAESAAAGEPASVEKLVDPETGAVTLVFHLPKGADGVSPTVAVTAITGGHRVTITDAEHQQGQSFDVLDGKDGRSVTGISMGADYKLTFTFSDGETWTTPTSIRGETGATPNIQIGTVSTLDPGQSATAQITGTPEEPRLNIGIPQGVPGEMTAASVAPVFSASTAYAAGDYVTYNGQLYLFTVAHAAGAWTGTDAEAASIAPTVSQLKTALTYFDDIPGTVQTVNFDTDGNPSSIVHTSNGAAVRTDTFTWGTNTVTEKRELADGSYITFVTDLTTLVTTISEIQEA